MRDTQEPDQNQASTSAVLYCTKIKTYYYLYAVVTISDYSGIVLGYQK